MRRVRVSIAARSLSDTDLFVGGGHLAFGVGDVRAAGAGTQ
jgi:hypothetical protein